MIEKRDLVSHLDSLLQKMSVIIQRQKNQFAEEIGISKQQFDVLCIIFDKGRITMGELCREISSACSTVTDLADKLEKEGYVERIREKRDRRVVRLNILPKGHNLIKSVMERRLRELEDIMETSDKEEGIKVMSFLETFVEKVEPAG